MFSPPLGQPDYLLSNIYSLWTVPTFVSAHTFCASRKPWFKRARAGFDIDAINCAAKCTTKIKARVHMNVVPRSTMSTNGETEN